MDNFCISWLCDLSLWRLQTSLSLDTLVCNSYYIYLFVPKCARKLSLPLENKDEQWCHGRMQAIKNSQETSTSHKMNVLETNVIERSGSGHRPLLSHAASASVHKCSAGFRGRPGNKFIPQAIRLSGRPEAGKEQEKRGWKRSTRATWYWLNHVPACLVSLRHTAPLTMSQCKRPFYLPPPCASVS